MDVPSFISDDSQEFQTGLESFIEFTCGQPAFMDRNLIRCHCRKCKNKADRMSSQFDFNYHVWRYQG